MELKGGGGGRSVGIFYFLILPVPIGIFRRRKGEQKKTEEDEFKKQAIGDATVLQKRSYTRSLQSQNLCVLKFTCK
jgi:hypothetical protein